MTTEGIFNGLLGRFNGERAPNAPPGAIAHRVRSEARRRRIKASVLFQKFGG